MAPCTPRLQHDHHQLWLLGKGSRGCRGAAISVRAAPGVSSTPHLRLLRLLFTPQARQSRRGASWGNLRRSPQHEEHTGRASRNPPQHKPECFLTLAKWKARCAMSFFHAQNPAVQVNARAIDVRAAVAEFMRLRKALPLADAPAISDAYAARLESHLRGIFSDGRASNEGGGEAHSAPLHQSRRTPWGVYPVLSGDQPGAAISSEGSCVSQRGLPCRAAHKGHEHDCDELPWHTTKASPWQTQPAPLSRHVSVQ